MDASAIPLRAHIHSGDFCTSTGPEDDVLCCGISSESRCISMSSYLLFLRVLFFLCGLCSASDRAMSNSSSSSFCSGGAPRVALLLWRGDMARRGGPTNEGYRVHVLVVAQSKQGAETPPIAMRQF